MALSHKASVRLFHWVDRLPRVVDLFLFRFLRRFVRAPLASSLKTKTRATTASAAKANPCQPNGASPCSIAIMITPAALPLLSPSLPLVRNAYIYPTGDRS